ncbi:MAG: hypothetical protein KGS00_03785 [Alphaproteobacteria bacterium]|nr:hypothetical protein [Alphaproteobacteria bacterium]
MSRRRKHRLPFAALTALAFNASLGLTAYVGAHAVNNAYGRDRPQYEASSEAISATRREIDKRFARLSTQGDQGPRETWSRFVREELDAGDMTTVRGLLLAAPAMLGNGLDGQALRARLEVSEDDGEEAILNAALVYLPEDVQMRYEDLNTPISERYALAVPADIGQPDDIQPETAEASPSVAPDPEYLTMESPAASLAGEAQDRGEFRVLGDMRDLAMQAARWSRPATASSALNDDVDEVSFILSGIGLTLLDPQAQEGASVVLSSRRADRLNERFEAYMERRIFRAAPPERLRNELAGRLRDSFEFVSNSEVIGAAFRAVADPGALKGLNEDLRIIQDIVEQTSAMSAVTILSSVRSSADLHRARLIAMAGGDRAVALARYDQTHFLESARTIIPWSNALRLQLAGIAASLCLMTVLALNVLWRSFMRTRPVRRSAIYALQETPAL